MTLSIIIVVEIFALSKLKKNFFLKITAFMLFCGFIRNERSADLNKVKRKYKFFVDLTFKVIKSFLRLINNKL